MGWYWGATAEEVAQRLQGSLTDVTTYATPSTSGTARIEKIMDRVKGSILAKISDKKTLNALQWGRFENHKVIDKCQNTSQTAVDYGQAFAGTVDTGTFRLGKNEMINSATVGLTSGFTIATNVLTITETKQLGDTFYASYSVDPDTITSDQLAEILIEWSALILGREEVMGGSGDDGGLSDFVESTILPNLTEMVNALSEDASISRLLRLNLDEPITNPKNATVRRIERIEDWGYSYLGTSTE